MFVNLQKWEENVDKAAQHAVDVYNDEVERLKADREREYRKDERALKHVEHQVEIDGWFAKHHIDYLLSVLDREVARVSKLNTAIAKAENEGNEKKVERLNSRLEKTLEEGDKHIERVAENVAKHLERDAKAAARHVVKGVERLVENDEDFEKELNKAAEKVADAIEKMMAKADIV